MPLSWRREMGLEWSLFEDAASAWSARNAPRMGAALAYYTIFSLAPLLLIFISISGAVFGEKAVRGELYWQLQAFAGSGGASAVQQLLKDAKLHPGSGIMASVLGFIMLLVGSSGVFVELRDDLNLIWEIPPRTVPMWRSILQPRLFSFALVLGAGLLITASLAASIAVQSIEKYALTYIAIPAFLVDAANLGVTFVATAVLFGLIYTVVPERRIPWRDVAAGSLVTAVLFSIGKFLVALYLGRASVGSPYGAAGSLVIFLAFVYYSFQIFLFGAEYTHLYSQRHGSLSREHNSVPELIHGNHRA